MSISRAHTCRWCLWLFQVRGPLWLFFVSPGAGIGDHLSKSLLKGAFFCLCQLGFGILEGSQDYQLLPSGDVIAGQGRQIRKDFVHKHLKTKAFIPLNVVCVFVRLFFSFLAVHCLHEFYSWNLEIISHLKINSNLEKVHPLNPSLSWFLRSLQTLARLPGCTSVSPHPDW